MIKSDTIIPSAFRRDAHVKHAYHLRPVLRLHLAIDMELLSVGLLLLHQMLRLWEIQ